MSNKREKRTEERNYSFGARVHLGKSPITLCVGDRPNRRSSLNVTPGNPKSSWHNTAMILLILASLAMFGTIAYTIALQEITNSAISYITGLLISVTGILLGLSGLTPQSKSLERMKLQVTLTIATLLWLVAVVIIAQTASGLFTFAASTATLLYLFLLGIALFTIFAVIY